MNKFKEEVEKSLTPDDHSLTEDGPQQWRPHSASELRKTPSEDGRGTVHRLKSHGACNDTTSDPSQAKGTDTIVIIVPAFSLVRVWVSSMLIVAMYISVFMVQNTLISQYLFHRFSQNQGNATVFSNKGQQACENSTATEDKNTNRAQKEASSTMLYITLVSSVPALLACLFAGSVSDMIGRKRILIACLTGAIVKAGALCLVIYLELPIGLLYAGSAVDGLVGSFFVTVMALTATISDITPRGEIKSVRFAVLEGITLVCGAGAQLGTGYLIQAQGFLVPSLVCACLLLACLFIALLVLPETLHKKRKLTWNVAAHVKKTFSFYLSDGDQKHGRYYFLLGLAAHVTIMFASTGKSSVETIFVLNKPICWSSVQIGIFGAVRMIIMSFAAVLMLKVCRNRLSLELTGVLCGISSVAGLVVESLATSTTLMYISSVVGILFTAGIPIPRSIMSHIAATDEQGALFSSMSCTETVVNLAATTMSTLIYNSSLETYRGACFLALAGVCLLYMASLGTLRALKKNEPNYVDLEVSVTDSSSESQDKKTGHPAE